MREELDIITAYNMVGTYRGAADICGTTHKTVKRVVPPRRWSGPLAKAPRPANYEDVRGLVAAVDTAKARISAKRLLPGPRGRVHRLGAQLPPPCRREDLAGQARPDPPAGVLVPVSTWSSTGA